MRHTWGDGARHRLARLDRKIGLKSRGSSLDFVEP
jgi:hypothetical protein